MRVMTAQSQIPIPRQILEEACDWFVDFRAGDVDGAARERFDRWLRPIAAAHTGILDITTAYARIPPAEVSVPVDVDELVARARSGIGGDLVPLGTMASTRQAQSPPSRRQPLLAACIALTALAGTLFAWIASRNQGVYRTGIGEERSIALADGSIVDLNARSRHWH